MFTSTKVQVREFHEKECGMFRERSRILSAKQLPYSFYRTVKRERKYKRQRVRERTGRGRIDYPVGERACVRTCSCVLSPLSQIRPRHRVSEAHTHRGCPSLPVYTCCLAANTRGREDESVLINPAAFPVSSSPISSAAVDSDQPSAATSDTFLPVDRVVSRSGDRQTSCRRQERKDQRHSRHPQQQQLAMISARLPVRKFPQPRGDFSRHRLKWTKSWAS